MSNLVNRVRTSDSVNIELYDKLKQISKDTKIPRSKLLDEAIDLLIKKYNNEDNKNNS